jgi:hypothetical protein
MVTFLLKRLFHSLQLTKFRGNCSIVGSSFNFIKDQAFTKSFLNRESVLLFEIFFTLKMVASAIFITDLSGKSIISRNYRGDVPLSKAVERFASYLNNVEDEVKKPIFQIDIHGDVMTAEKVGTSGPGGETYVYVAVSTN